MTAPEHVIYSGHPRPIDDLAGPVRVTVIGDEPNGRDLDPRRDLMNHSPDGFQWGYAGSGPAQLALAILADALGDDMRAVRLHQRFKSDFLARRPRSRGWSITRRFVMNWAARQQERPLRVDAHP